MQIIIAIVQKAMTKKLDARRIEKSRAVRETVNTQEEEKKRIRETIAKNRRGERKVTVIQPTQKIYA